MGSQLCPAAVCVVVASMSPLSFNDGFEASVRVPVSGLAPVYAHELTGSTVASVSVPRVLVVVQYRIAVRLSPGRLLRQRTADGG